MRILRALVVAATALMLTAAMPAAADPWKDESGHGRHWRHSHGHGHGHGHWRHRDRGYVVYGAPGYVYYPPPPVHYAPPPPPVYYAPPPPPAYYTPSPSISFGLTFPIK